MFDKTYNKIYNNNNVCHRQNVAAISIVFDKKTHKCLPHAYK